MEEVKVRDATLTYLIESMREHFEYMKVKFKKVKL